MEQHEVVIVGGGLVGPLLSLALARAGLDCCVIDAAPAETRADPEFDGRAYALSAGSVNMLRVLGLWGDLAAQAQPILDVKVSDGRAGQGAAPFHLHFDHREGEDGPLGQMLEDRYLRQALIAAMAEAGVTHRAPLKATGLAPGLLETEAGPIRAQLVVGCDGRASRVAAWSGIGRTGWDYGQTSLVCAIAHERPHLGIAHQFFTPAGPLAILPLPGNRSSIVWTERTARAEAINALDEDGYLAALRPVFGGFLGEIGLEGRRFSYPLTLSLANRLTGPRVALAGDAGHGIHPLAGQGLNLGIRDAASLAEVLILARRRGQDLGAQDVLDGYAAWRRFDIAAMAAATDGINRLFSNDNPLLRGVRDLGLATVGKLPGLRRAMMREAAGLTGARPALLQGRPI